ncbi:hypothetical protein ERHA55_14220 [Erwinia rhapontici]|nr:hypothetical protein ERHA55_14220 [Erwinia rhapontici]
MATLLLIDDHPLVQVALEAALVHAPFPLTLLSAENQQDALALLDSQRVSLVILDIGLPDSDGLQLLKRIKRLAPSLPVVIYSAQEERVWPRLAEAAGASGFVAKRQPLSQLLSAVLAVLGDNGLSLPSSRMKRCMNSSPLKSCRSLLCWHGVSPICKLPNSCISAIKRSARIKRILWIKPGHSRWLNWHSCGSRASDSQTTVAYPAAVRQ